YKSEFLANMSHELRTPLNSLLILSKQLAENKNNNLTAEQVRHSKTVHSAGQDLLGLINEILDLSKVEAVKMAIHPKKVNLDRVLEYLEQTFLPVAKHKDLKFRIQVDQDIPNKIRTDENRLLQLLKNLLSNSFQFTELGEVTMRVHRPSSEINL